jgi:redox-sensitive bicupin YhaK (pirin superfamily)
VSDQEKLPGAVTCASGGERRVFEAIPARRAELEGLTIRRLLPRSRRRLVGPWCFADLYGPLGAAQRMDVPPHPHIGLQTVSWLFAGELRHDDSLGRSGVARPGALNLMTAGEGIAHAERALPPSAAGLHGLQLWLALPRAHRQTAARFDQYAELPQVEADGGSLEVLMGALAGASSPALAFSPLVAAELRASAGRRLVVPLTASFEHALLLVDGAASFDGEKLGEDVLYYLGRGREELVLAAGPSGARVVLLGGEPLGETVLMWWNFVAGDADAIVAAREDWAAGRRFGEVADYPGARLPAPPLLSRPVPPNPAS